MSIWRACGRMAPATEAGVWEASALPCLLEREDVFVGPSSCFPVRMRISGSGAFFPAL